MSNTLSNTTVEILGKVYSIRCPEDELNHLNKAAKYLNDKMQEVKDSGKAINLERIAIMAAINISYELLLKDNDKAGLVQNLNQKLIMLNDKISEAMSEEVVMESSGSAS